MSCHVIARHTALMSQGSLPATGNSGQLVVPAVSGTGSAIKTLLSKTVRHIIRGP